MLAPTSEPTERMQPVDILTLPEAASLLRVEEAALAELAARTHGTGSRQANG